MRNHWLKLPAVSAMALSAMLLVSCAPAYAQYERPYDRGGYGQDYEAYAYHNGFRAGSDEGQRDWYARKPYGFKRDNAYENADWGFRGGDKRRYRHEFRRGYEDGYARGYRRAGGGWRDRDRDWRDREWRDR